MLAILAQDVTDGPVYKTKVDVDHTFGSWAAHHGYNVKLGRWVVTHMPTGRCVPMYDTKGALYMTCEREQAIAIAKRLGRECPFDTMADCKAGRETIWKITGDVLG